MKKIVRILTFVLLLVMLFPTAADAATPYQTHTFMAKAANALYSPDAYVPDVSVDYRFMGLSSDFSEPADLHVDCDGNVYLVDSGSGKSKVVVLDRYYKLIGEIKTFQNDQGVNDSFSGCKGIFTTEDSIYVCDTNANRIVIFDRHPDAKGNFSFRRIIQKPNSDLFGEDAIYKPVACAVDSYGRIYVVSSTTYQGVIVMSEEGDFTGFIGAQNVSYNIVDIVWRRFQTEEQLAQQKSYIPTELNNINITDENFIYVTTDNIDAKDRASAVRAKTGTYSPVKLLNPSGDQIMKRNGFYDPGGNLRGTSSIVDVAIGPEKTWTIIDQKFSRCYTYDYNGNLLFAFGNSGSQLGNLKTVKACDYQGDKLILLDSSQKSFTVYKRTEYGDTLISAIANTNAHQYDKAIEDWTEILKRNSNYDSAYIGIGQSLYRDGKYEEALEYYRSAYDTSNYSTSYKEIRKEWLSKYILLIPVVVIVLAVLLVKFSKYATKVNEKTAIKLGKRSLKEELLFVFHVILHPFDGFWDLKHERRGSVRAGVLILAVVILSFFYNGIGRGYIVNSLGSYSTLFAQARTVLIPVFLWVTANWCLTTLFDGEGSYKDVFVATCYALAPLPIFVILSTILSNVVTAEEAGIVSFLLNLGYVWVGLLLFFGMMVTHDYSMGKNILVSLGTILGMAVIMSVAFLFTMLVQKMVGFVSAIIEEISYRV